MYNLTNSYKTYYLTPTIITGQEVKHCQPTEASLPCVFLPGSNSFSPLCRSIILNFEIFIWVIYSVSILLVIMQEITTCILHLSKSQVTYTFSSLLDNVFQVDSFFQYSKDIRCNSTVFHCIPLLLLMLRYHLSVSQLLFRRQSVSFPWLFQDFYYDLSRCAYF